MLGTDSAVNHDRAADMATVATLESEIAKLKESATAKQSEIAQLEKELGLDAKSRMMKKMEPIASAFNQAVDKAKPVVKSAAEKVAKKASELRDKYRSSNSGGEAADEDNAPPASNDVDAVEPEKTKQSSASVDIADGNSDNPYMVRSDANPPGSGGGGGNSDNPYLTKLPQKEAPIAQATGATPATSQSVAPTTSIDSAEAKAASMDDEIERQKKITRIETLQIELRDERTLIASRESEVAWLYKKHKITQPNAFTKLRSNVQGSETYQKLGEKLGVAKEKTSWGLKVAGDRAKSLWQSASSKVREMTSKGNAPKNSTSSTSSSWTSRLKSTSSSPSSKAGKEDMYERYS